MGKFEDVPDPEDAYSEDEEVEVYIYSANTIKDILEKFRNKYNERLDPNFNPDLWLEDFTIYDYAIEVQKRNMDKFDRLTDQGYRLDYMTGEFKLSA